MISQRAIDLIVACEVSSKATYEKKYRHPEWPGGASGVTVAIGYDLGYASPAKIKADWSGRVPAAMLAVMVSCSGYTGERARLLLPAVKAKIDIPWDQATAVFLDRDVPQWTKAVCDKIANAKDLPPDSLGALVSLAYNRGASFDAPDDRYREMRDLKSHTVSKQWRLDPADLRAMKRLWPNVHGLQARREAEAALFERGLKEPQAPVPETHVAPAQPETKLPPTPPSKAEHVSAGATATVTAATANQAAQSGYTPAQIAIIVCIGLAVAAAVWIAVRTYRKSQPVTARQKDPAPVVAI